MPDWGILVGTDRAGLKFYDRHNRKTETVIPDIQVRDIKQCSENTYWIASESGVYILNMADRSITHLQKSLTNEYTISDNAAYSITKTVKEDMGYHLFRRNQLPAQRICPV